jgi:ribonuclease P protein component
MRQRVARLFSSAVRRDGDCFVLYRLSGRPGLRTGFLGGRSTGNAVARNRVKRIMRAWLRDRGIEGDFIVRLRPGISRREKEWIESSLERTVTSL